MRIFGRKKQKARNLREISLLIRLTGNRLITGL